MPDKSQASEPKKSLRWSDDLPEADQLLDPSWIDLSPVQAGPILIALGSNQPEVVERFRSLFSFFPAGDPEQAKRHETNWRDPRADRIADIHIHSRVPTPRSTEAIEAYASAMESQRHIPTGTEGSRPVAVTSTPDQERLWLWIGNRVRAESYSLPRLEARLIQNLSRWVIDVETDRAHLHAAFVAQASLGVLILDTEQVGRNSAVVDLCRKGWNYGSASLVSVDHDRSGPHLVVAPHLGPPIIEQSFWYTINDLVADFDQPIPSGLTRLVIDPGYLGESVPEPAAVDLIVWIRPSNASPAIEEVGPGAMFRQVLMQLLDVQRLDDGQITDLAQGVAAARRVCLRVGDPTEVRALLDEIVSDPQSGHRSAVPGQTEVTAVESGPPGRSPGPIHAGSVLQRSSTVSSWSFDDGAVLYDRASGQAVHLDRAGADLWLALDGSSSIDKMVAADSTGHVDAEHLQGLLAFVTSLAKAGLLQEALSGSPR